MRGSVELSLAGIFIAATLAVGVVDADARGGGGSNGPDAFIGIIGSNPQPYNYSAGSDYPAGGYQANTAHSYRHGHGGQSRHGPYDSGNYQGY